MEITVCGIGEKSFKPNQVVLNITLEKLEKNNKSALEQGELQVYNFLQIMKKFDFKISDFKTLNYNIREEYDYENNKRKFMGVKYSRTLKLSFDYNMSRLANIIEECSNLSYTPKLNIRFNLKNNKQVEAEILKDAYNDALRQAQAIASASGHTIKTCLRTNFAPFNDNFYSKSQFNNEESMYVCRSSGAKESIETNYIPEDITITKEVYCEFLAE